MAHEIDIEEIRRRIKVKRVLDLFGIKVHHNRCACPIHKGDNKQAFSFNDDFYYCHTNGCKGDIFTLYGSLRRCDFKASVLDLANIAGVNIPITYKPSVINNMREMVESPTHKAKREQEEDIYFLETLRDCYIIIHKHFQSVVKVAPTAQDYSSYLALDADIDELDNVIQALRWKMRGIGQ